MVGPAEMKPFKIKALLTYVSYVTILIMGNMRTQQLTFSKMASSQDLCIIYFKERKRFWSDIISTYVSMKYISLNKSGGSATEQNGIQDSKISENSGFLWDFNIS